MASCGLLFTTLDANTVHPDTEHRKASEGFSQQNPSSQGYELLGTVKAYKDDIIAKKTREIQSSLHLENSGRNITKLWH